ncbi:cation:proton antiporter [Candidatus Thorarchaeota archaeon]|nr:MAG: cation:proton antiporter [Candidatus Thorarchaeota archaeon]
MSDPILLIGTALVLAFLGAKIMKRFNIPQILGFILAGLFLGTTGMFSSALRQGLFPLVEIALGLIGYSIGLEIQKKVFAGKIRKMSIVLFFVSSLVFFGVTLLMFMIIGQLHIALVFGALAVATDPASTVMVIWERRCKGPLTDTLMYILAVDDVIAILLVNIAISLLGIFYSGAMNIIDSILIIGWEIGLSCFAGFLAGAVITVFINREDTRKDLLEFELGMIILLVGVMIVLHGSPILACMIFGFVMTNWVDSEKQAVCHTLRDVMSPIVMIFFVYVGASVDINLLATGGILLLAIVYVAGSILSKYMGAYIGTKITRSPENISKYLGFCLFSQAGVAVGLSLILEQNLFQLGIDEAHVAGTLILSTIILATMILQIIGPISASKGLQCAGEFYDVENQEVGSNLVCSSEDDSVARDDSSNGK